MKPVPIASVQLGEREVAAVAAVLRSGRLATGSLVERFEAQFAQLAGAEYAIAVSSGTAALHIAYLALLQPGDEVLVPGFTHISTASMVHFAGGRPVLCDVDRQNFTLTLEDAARKLSERTTAIVPVHLFGNACDIHPIAEFARSHHLKIIWDAAQAHGTRYHGRDVGSFGDAAVYSFYPTKNMTTGEGGMIVTSDHQLYERSKRLRSHGERGKYSHESFGLNYRMTEISGAIGLEQLKKLAGFTAKRRCNASYLSERLVHLDAITVPWVADAIEHSFHQYSILLAIEQLRASRDEFVDMLAAEGVETAVHYPRALNQQPIFATDQRRLPNSEWLAQRIVSLPVHPSLSQADLDRVVSGVSKVVARLLLSRSV